MLLGILFCTACGGAVQTPGSSSEGTSSSTPAVLSQPDSDNTDEMFFRDPPDSNTYSWEFAPERDYQTHSRFTGRHVRHPSGLLRLWFDTATRATEDTPAGTVHVDSIVVSGLQRGEFLSYHCNARGQWETQIVGLVRDSTNYTRPRLSWLLDTASNRIRPFPSDSVLCTAAEIFYSGH